MQADITIVVDDVMNAIIAFLQPFVDNPGNIIRAQVNRVAPPIQSFTQLTEIFSTPVSLPKVTPNGLTQTIQAFINIAVQIDFYGPSASEECAATVTAFRSSYAHDVFPENIRPLFCDNGRQTALVNGEEQYESRWTATVNLQYNPAFTLSQQSAIEVKIDSIRQAD